VQQPLVERVGGDDQGRGECGDGGAGECRHVVPQQVGDRVDEEEHGQRGELGRDGDEEEHSAAGGSHAPPCTALPSTTAS
jgi:hypothetical protein